MPSIEIKPASGLMIKDPIYGDFLPPSGRVVEVSDYWTRRLRDGDVVYTTSSASSAPPSVGPILQSVFPSGHSVLVGQPARGALMSGGAVMPSVMMGGSSFMNQLTDGAASTSAATTYEHVRYVARKPVACMLHYKHNVSGGGHAPLQFAVGACPTLTSPAQNVVGVTFAGASVVPASPVASATAVQHVFSDVMPFTAVARTDGQPGFIVATRVVVPQDASARGFAYCAPVNGNPSIGAGLAVFGTRQQAGDFVSANQGGFTTTAMSSNILFADLILFYEDGTTQTILGVGDSNTTGEFTGSGYNGWARQLAGLITTAGVATDYYNQAWGGHTSAVYLAASLPVVAKLRPRFATYAVHSPNDGSLTPGLLAQQKAQAAQFIEACRAVGTIPVLSTPMPYAAPDAPTQAYMLAVQSWVKAYAGAALGLPVVDLMGVLGAAGNPAQFASGFGASGDTYGLHSNDAGHAAAAASAFQVLSPWL